MNLKFEKQVVYLRHECYGAAITFYKSENSISVSMAYDYTCRFCYAASSVFVSLGVAFRASRASSRGDHEEAKKIELEQ